MIRKMDPRSCCLPIGEIALAKGGIPQLLAIAELHFIGLPTFPFLGFYSWDVTARHKKEEDAWQPKESSPEASACLLPFLKLFKRIKT